MNFIVFSAKCFQAIFEKKKIDPMPLSIGVLVISFSEAIAL
jgi:hypothetical protein